MSNILWKNFYICFSKFKCLSTSLPPPPPSPPQQYHNHPSPTVIKSFNSLYDPTSNSLFSSSDHFSDDFDTDSPPPDIAAVFASHRFFFPSPGHSNSIIDLPESDPEVAGAVAVQTLSTDPYSDFRLSMQEMVEARVLADVKADCDYLHELLSCYLSLNPKNTHKFIIGAFTDLLVSLMLSTTTDSRHRKPESHQKSAVSRPWL